jgi:hypothetical protein
MEFFAEARADWTVAALQARLRISDLPRWCASIQTVFADAGEAGEVYCVWGRFRVRREPIRNGLRFTLPDCPNALQWTVTVVEPGRVRVHCTIDRTEHDPDFVESIAGFVEDWRAGLERAGASGRGGPARGR